MKSHLKWSVPSQSQVYSSTNRSLVDAQRIFHSFQSSWECRRSNVPNFRGSVNWGVKEEKKWSKKRKEDINRQRRVRGIKYLLARATDSQKKRKRKKKRERSERREQEKKEKEPASHYQHTDLRHFTNSASYFLLRSFLIVSSPPAVGEVPASQSAHSLSGSIIHFEANLMY